MHPSLNNLSKSLNTNAAAPSLPYPTIRVLTIKYKYGKPDRVKLRIIVLGNQHQYCYDPNQKYAPVLSQNAFRTLLSISVFKGRTLLQGDFKNAFCNGILPDDEIIVCRPPAGCPFSKPGELWKLKNTFYGLVRSPLHWFTNISPTLTKSS